MLLTVPNQLMYSCDDNTFHGMTGSTETWNRHADGAFYSNILVDDAGHVCYGASVSELALGPHSRLFVTTSGMYGRIARLSD